MNFYQSFSGTDTLAFIMMPGCTPVVIGSLSTISYSMFRNKKPVINIGRTNINGVTRGSRIFAGTMIFTLINQHWLRNLLEQQAVSYLKNFKELKVDELPLFDIMIISANEYGSVVSMYIYGIDFTDEAQTISVEDLFTENTFSFVARDISTFKAMNTKKNPTSDSSSGKRGDVFDSLGGRIYRVKSSNTDIEDIARYYVEKNQERLVERQKTRLPTLVRDLYLNTSHLMIGEDVMNLQILLSKAYPDININGMFDEQTKVIVKQYQSDNGLTIDGIVNDKVFAHILSSTDSKFKEYIVGIVVNKNGTFCYKNASYNSNVTMVFPFKEKIVLLELFESDIDGYSQKWYKTPYGYVVAEDVYSSFGGLPIAEFPTVKYQDTSSYTKIIQEALSHIYPNFIQSGIYDTNTVVKIKQIQEENGLFPSGVVDSQTWLLLQSLSGSIKQTQDDFMFTYNIAPGVYSIGKTTSLMNSIAPYFVNISCSNTVTVKNTVIVRYPNGAKKVFSEYRTGNPLKISVADLQKALVYNPSQGATPASLEWIVYPLNRAPYKWTFNLA